MRDTVSRSASERTEDDVRGSICPQCFSHDSFHVEEVEEPVHAGTNTALVRVRASVCQVCGYRLVDVSNMRKLEQVEERLERGDVTGMKPVGITYRVE